MMEHAAHQQGMTGNDTEWFGVNRHPRSLERNLTNFQLSL